MTEPGLRNCQSEIDAPDELLWRQVHPRFVHEDVVTAEGFVGPQPGTSEVSVVRSNLRTCEEALAYHCDVLGLASAGTWAVSVGDVQTLGARAVDDSGCDDVDTPGHAFIDLRELPKKERKRARAVLATAATNRGRFPQAA